MKALWAGAPMTAEEVIAALGQDVEWQPRTVKTLLGRLVKKGALSFERNGRQHVYSSAVTERECKSQQTRRFLARVFDGALPPLVAHMVEEGALGKKDLDELRSLVDKAERRRKSRLRR